MRGKVSRVILVCTVLMALTYAGWWPFEKKEENNKRGRRNRNRDTPSEPDRVETEDEMR